MYGYKWNLMKYLRWKGLKGGLYEANTSDGNIWRVINSPLAEKAEITVFGNSKAATKWFHELAYVETQSGSKQQVLSSRLKLIPNIWNMKTINDQVCALVEISLPLGEDSGLKLREYFEGFQIKRKSILSQVLEKKSLTNKLN
jgi:hypothetical protein